VTEPTLDQFLNTLKQSHLLPDEDLNRLGKRLMRAKGKLDASQVARSLVQGGHLTLWQVRQLLAGRTTFFLGRYKLLDRIGEGGMGVVFKAQHAMMDRVVALKVMSRALLNNSRAHERFAREVKAAAALNHRNIIAAYDADRVGSTHFLVMEYVEGRDLNAWLRARGPLPISLAIECAMQAAEGLGHAHRRGMVHRDIKPVNMLVSWDTVEKVPVIKILDMGLARFVSESREDGGITKVGNLVGTPDYVAPEAAENFKKADIRADIFSLGCSLFKLITGRLPFPGENAMEKVLARTRQDAEPLSNYRDDVPQEVEEIVAKMLARDAAQRYQTPEELVAALKPLAASTLGDSRALDFFEPSRLPDEEKLPDRVEPDMETSIEEFFHDFSASPAREEEMVAELDDVDAQDDDLMLAPVDDEPPRTASSKPKTPVNDAAQTTTQPDLAKTGGAVEVVDPLDELLGTPGDMPGVATKRKKRKRGAAAGDPLSFAVEGEAKSVSVMRKSSQRRWDSPLLLIGGGALILLLFVGGLMFWSLTRQTGDEALRLADEDYRSGAYSQAILRYGTYLEQFPNHTGASSARVRRGLAQLRQVVEEGNDWPRALSTARNVMSEISKQPAFGEARPELAGLLPPIAEGLAQSANQQNDVELVTAAEEALALVEKYVPSSLRPTDRMQEVERLLALTRRATAEDEALANAVEQMKASAADGDIAAAYETRTGLLRDYPDLENDPALNEAVLAVVEAEQNAVTTEELNQQPADPASDGPVAGSFALVDESGADADLASADDAFLAISENAIYSIGRNGQVVWQRPYHAGLDATTPAFVALADGDVLKLDRERTSILRIAKKNGNGRSLWRQSFENPVVGSPVLLGDRFAVATSAGQLLLGESKTGKLSRSITLPHNLDRQPTTRRSGDVLWQLAEDSSLFVIDAADGTCRQCFHVGHRAGSITAPAIVVDRYLLIPEADRLRESRLNVLRLEDDGRIAEIAQRIRLTGLIASAPVESAGRVFVATDQGALYAFDVAAGDTEEPLRSVAEVPATSRAPATAFIAADGNRVCMADDRLTLFELQAASGRLMPRWVQHPGERFLQSPILGKDHVYHVRLSAAGEATLVAAAKLQSGEDAWQTEVGSPVLHLFTENVDGEGAGALAITAAGDVYRVDPAEASDAAVPPVTKIEPLNKSLASAISIGLTNTTWAIIPSVDSKRAALLDVAGDDVSTRWLSLPDQLAGRPAAMAGRLVVPGKTGQVYVVDPTTGEQVVEPFQPRIHVAQPLEWTATSLPAAGELFLANSSGEIFHIGVDRNPQPHLVARKTEKLEVPITGPAIALGELVHAIDERRQLVTLGLPEMNLKTERPLDGPVVGQPTAVGDYFYIQTQTESGEINEQESFDGEESEAVNKLWCFQQDGTLRWQSAVPPLTDSIVAKDGALIVAARDGRVLLLTQDSGQISTEISVDVPLSAGPVATASQILLGTRSGAVLQINLP